MTTWTPDRHQTSSWDKPDGFWTTKVTCGRKYARYTTLPHTCRTSQTPVTRRRPHHSRGSLPTTAPSVGIRSRLIREGRCAVFLDEDAAAGSGSSPSGEIVSARLAGGPPPARDAVLARARGTLVARPAARAPARPRHCCTRSNYGPPNVYARMGLPALPVLCSIRHPSVTLSICCTHRVPISATARGVGFFMPPRRRPPAVNCCTWVVCFPHTQRGSLIFE